MKKLITFFSQPFIFSIKNSIKTLFYKYLRENIRSGAGVKGQIYATNQCLPRHTFNEKPTHPIIHNCIPHTRIREQTLSNTPKPIPSTPLL